MALPKATRPLLLLLLGASLVLAKTLPRNPGDYKYADDDEDNSPAALAAAAAASAAAAAAMESRIEQTHGTLGCLAFAAFFPLGAIALRLAPPRLRLPLHVALQILALLMATTCLALGLYMAWGNAYLGTYHAVLGIIAVAGVFLQPISGYLHHHFYKKRHSRTGVSYLHIFAGIGFITLGAINGGFGLELNGADTKFMIVYGVFAALIWLIWMAVSAMAQLRRGRQQAAALEGVKGHGSERELKPDATKRENYA